MLEHYPMRIVLLGFAATMILAPLARGAGDARWLWQMGKDDHQDAEFALAPDGLHRFKDDPTFLIGTSEPAKDWPYIHPGPSDGWAGGRAHAFGIVFGLADVGSAGECRLAIGLVDTHSSGPPHLTILINGRKFERQMPPGAGDPSADGHPEHGKPYRFDIEFPSDLLHRGANTIEITNDRGSWMLYDWLGLQATPGTRLTKLSSFTTVQATEIRGLVEKDGKLWQPIEVTIHHVGPETEAIVKVDGTERDHRTVKSGSQALDILVPQVDAARTAQVSVEAAGQTFAETVDLNPVRKLTIYVLPQSHHDLGYTDLQANIEQKQMENIKRGIDLARRTADYPEGARFVWNLEVLWGADFFLHRTPSAERAEFEKAVRKGQVAINGMYANELTGLCRPEELLQLFRCGTRLSKELGVPVDSAMLSDVPGMTWGCATAMSQAGIRYFSLAPNYFDRIGTIMVTWQDKPFWWVGPSGKDKVLVWVPWNGYGLSHRHHRLTPAFVGEYQQWLDGVQFPYGISYIRWSGHGDNALPDPQLCEDIKDWNAKYAWPKFRIASTHEAFAAFEKQYGKDLPQFKGDLTPYWEDGAGSSARETALSRNAAERLVQAEALRAIVGGPFPAPAFEDAWRNVLLYSEHTWGAWCSVSDSENPLTISQWNVKKGFAEDADRESRKLLNDAFKAAAEHSPVESAVDVFNTNSWPVSQLVLVANDLSTAGDRVTDDKGQPVPSQRLSTGELALLARDVPPFSAVRFHIGAGTAFGPSKPVTLDGAVLANGTIRAQVDERTGGITDLTRKGIDRNFADSSGGEPLNDYVYLPGDNLADLQHNGPATITPIERGPLVASLRIDSEAPGCNHLSRELRLVAGDDCLTLANVIDKKRVPLNPHPGEGGPGGAFAQRGSKESVSFAFPFDVPDGQVRLSEPLAVMRPEADQLPGACKNWLPVGRWADVSNHQEGVTLATLDAPLVELGHLSTLLGSQSNPDVWRKHIEPTQKIYSWVMNNHWGTNYRAYQEGVVTFRYALRPHGAYDPAEAARFAAALSQPLIVRAAAGPDPGGVPRLRVEPDDVLVTTLKPADDGNGLIVRLFGASGQDRKVTLSWSKPSPTEVWLSDLGEQPLSRVNGPIDVPGWELVTLRAQEQSGP
ncbi:MAG TPA: polysaccharide lyase family protein [Tepidisphaeraceae bacterium]